MMRYQVRFHLGKGANYGKWQVKGPGGVQYHDPATTSLTMLDCQLRNQRGTAQKVHDGANKSVCAWIDANEVFVSGPIHPLEIAGIPVSYNPKVAPYWRNLSGGNIDGKRLSVLRTFGKQVSFTGERVETVGGLVRLAPSAAEEHALGPMRKER